MKLLFVLTLLIAIGLFIAVLRLSKTNSRLSDLLNQANKTNADSVHDATHPVFNVQQLYQARQRFEIEHKNRLKLETELYNSNEWHARTNSLTSQLQVRLRAICETLVECECAWKEYECMVEGNLAVVNGRESRTALLKSFNEFLDQTRGTSVVMSVAPNSTKVKRVEEILSNWIARLADATVKPLNINIPDNANELTGLA